MMFRQLPADSANCPIFAYRLLTGLLTGVGYGF
jgi:hypothetical protein